MRKRVWLWVLLCFLSLSAAGCGAEKAPQGDRTLWVLTEKSPSDGMNYQAERIAGAFAQAHPGVSVRIEIIPTEPEERSNYLYQLRTSIMAGEGPDIYLLPTGSTLQTDTARISVRALSDSEIEPLFSDVNQAMENGIFQDVQPYYQSDASLRTEDLNKTVMDAGTVNGRRYVLPLRYNMPVIMVDPEALPFPLEDNLTVTELAARAISGENTMLAIGLQMRDDFSLFSRLFDYPNGEVLITREEIARYLSQYQQIRAMSALPLEELLDSWLKEIFASAPEDLAAMAKSTHTYGLRDFCDATVFTCFGTHWSTSRFPAFAGGLPDALENAAINQFLGGNLVCLPLCPPDGSVVAEVTYYGAVGCSCEDPELAYAFLREFLTEDYQWDILRPRTDYTGDSVFQKAKEVQNRGLVENSWPVRSKNSVGYLWQTLQYQIYRFGSNSFRDGTEEARNTFCKTVVLTDEDLPVLSRSIDEVRFPIYLSGEGALPGVLARLNQEDGTPTDVDIDELAGEVWQNLWWHLAEG